MADKKQVGYQLAEILDGYAADVRKAAEKAINKTARETVKKIKDAAPRSGSSGRHYADGWATYKDRLGVVVVYNKYKPQLTHLLEKGHAKVNGGRVPGQAHIGPAEEWAAGVIVENVRRELK